VHYRDEITWELGAAYLRRPNHSLQTSDQAKVNVVLKGTHRDESTCDQALPVVFHASVISYCLSYLGVGCLGKLQVDSGLRGKLMGRRGQAGA